MECHAKGYEHPTPLFIGPPGIGKTYICSKCSKFLGLDFVRIQCSANTEMEDIFGRFLNVEGAVIFRESELVQKVQDGSTVCVVFDEVNLLSADALSVVMALIRQRSFALSQVRFAHKGRSDHTFRYRDLEVDLTKVIFCATMNPEAEGDSRKAMPAESLQVFNEIHFGALTDKEMEDTVADRWNASLLPLPVAMKCREIMDVGLRGLLRLESLLAAQCDIDLALRLSASLRHDPIDLCRKLHSYFSEAPEGVSMGRRLRDPPRITDKNLQWAAGFVPAEARRWYPGFVMIAGPECSGKRTLAHLAARRAGKEVIEVHVTAATEERDLFGEYMPVSQDGEMRIEFVKGPVLRAVESGKWLVVNHIHRVRSGVLDRLLPLGETPLPSMLSLADLGAQDIKVHEDFRFLATATLSPGQPAAFSKAFQDRCVVARVDDGKKSFAAAAANIQQGFRSFPLIGEVAAQHVLRRQSPDVQIPPTLRGLRRAGLALRAGTREASEAIERAYGKEHSLAVFPDASMSGGVLEDVASRIHAGELSIAL